MEHEGRQPEELPLEGFLDELTNIHNNIDDRGLAFILGAGASVSSGIPAGSTLVDD